MNKQASSVPSDEFSESSETGVKAAWNKCLKQIETQVPWQTFQTWFLPIIPVTIIDNKFILRVPSRFFFEWIDSHYGELLKKVTEKTLGNSIQVEYLIAPTPTPKSLPEQVEATEEGASAEVAEKHLSEDDFEIDPTMNFENFFSGKENKLVRKAAEHVAVNIGKSSYNPLVICGSVGTGKSHLIHAIANEVANRAARKKIVIMSSEHFLHEYIYSLQSGDINKFKRKLIKADVFLLDDVEFLSNKIKSQEILLYIIKELLKKRKQVVITSSVVPSALPKFNANLISFMQKGLIVDLVYPQHETREAFIRHYLQKNQVEVDEAIIDFLVDNFTDNLHLLNSALTRIIAQISLLGKPLSIEDVHIIVAQIYPQWQGLNGMFSGQKVMKTEAIINSVSSYFNIPVDILVGKSRKREIVLARQIALYLSRELTGESLEIIGYNFGERHHATVIYATKRIKSEMAKNPVLKNTVKQIKENLLND